MSAEQSAAETEHNIAIWKVKSLVKSLSAARGNGTSLVSLIIPPGGQISQVTALMTQEYGAASNIKSRVTRQSVQSAITSARQRLTLYNHVPTNGLVIYCGDITLDDGKQKKVAFDFEPFKPINTSIYRCDNKFITEPLAELLQDNASFGFIVMDGNGSLFGTLAGNTKNILFKFTVDLPKKHGRGGQSALRFARLREESRHNYVRKVAEHATKFFIENDVPNVGGLILAGYADFKTDLSKSDMFDPRLAAKILKIVDISYGGENGFNQAIDLASDALSNVKFVAEKKLIAKFLEEIAQDTGKICYGVVDTFKALEMGAVETLIVWEDLEVSRLTLRNPKTAEESTVILLPAVEAKGAHLKDASGNDLEVVEKVTLIEWFAENYKKFGAQLEFVTDKSQEGNQFVSGFGGVGGMLRYQLDVSNLDGAADDDDYYLSEDEVM